MPCGPRCCSSRWPRPSGSSAGLPCGIPIFPEAHLSRLRGMRRRRRLGRRAASLAGVARGRAAAVVRGRRGPGDLVDVPEPHLARPLRGRPAVTRDRSSQERRGSCVRVRAAPPAPDRSGSRKRLGWAGRMSARPVAAQEAASVQALRAASRHGANPQRPRVPRRHPVFGNGRDLAGRVEVLALR